MSILEQRDKLLEILERAGHNLNLEFFGNLVHNVRYKVDYHLINARVKYYSNSKNPRVIHTKLNNSHLVSLRTHPNEKYVVRTGDFLHLGPEDTINDILQYYETSLKALGIGLNPDLSIFDADYETSEAIGECKVGKLVSLSSGSDAETPEKMDVFAGFDSNGDEHLESTPAGNDSSALCKESATSNSTFQLTTASLRFDEHLRDISEPKRQSSLRTLKKEIMSRFGGDSSDLENPKKEKRKLSLIRRKSTQQVPLEPSIETKEAEVLIQKPKPSFKLALGEDNDLIDLSDCSLKHSDLNNEASSESNTKNEKETSDHEHASKNFEQLDRKKIHVKEKPSMTQIPKVHMPRERPRRRNDIKASAQVKKSFRVKGQASPNKNPQRFYEKLAKKEKAKKPWNTVYNEISLSAARLSTGSEGTSRGDYESLKSDLTDSKRRDSDVFAENLRQGKAKFYSPTIVKLT